MVSMIETREVLAAELADLALVLLEEPKNIHGWQYRQWLIRRFDAWDGELCFLNEMLKSDPYNNSAWNHRLFLLKSRPNLLIPKHEVEFIKEMLAIDPLSNRSILNYANGLLANTQVDIQVALNDVLASFDLLEGFKSTYL
jgi:protein farnesyltransferase/geranylgeranyltransferase type-1 subunit alpha